MREQHDNETWLIDTGHDVIEKKAATGPASLNPRERLIYCLWVADYGMKNAGDLEPPPTCMLPSKRKPRGWRQAFRCQLRSPLSVFADLSCREAISPFSMRCAVS
ncbi:hypothetical protein [Phenylobacterium sp.]|uniref:hypothetical protein n=1 Tax=Phenylobacterium sp. TaxID=1871053 RepID=UPI002FC82062